MQHLEVSGAVRPLKWSLGIKWLSGWPCNTDGFISLRQETGFSLVLWVQTSRVQNFITDKAFGWSQSNKEGRDSSVGIATRYGLNGPGIKSRWGRRATFFAPVQTSPGVPPSLPYNRYRVSFPGVKRPGRGVNHPPQLAPRVKKVQSYASTPTLGLHCLLWGKLYLLHSTTSRFITTLEQIFPCVLVTQRNCCLPVATGPLHLTAR